MPEIVFDTCVISNYALAGALDVLKGLYRTQARITVFVAAEVMRGIQAGHTGLGAIPQAVEDGWLKNVGLGSREEKRVFEACSISLGLGEASSLALAKSRGYVFASDDKVARAEATRIAVPVTGTLGILVKAVRASVCDLEAADGYLGKMIKAGFFSPVRSFSEIK